MTGFLKLLSQKLRIFLIIFLLTFLSISVVYSQSQNEINPLFDASREDQLYANYNYDCSNLTWPIDVKGVYRKYFPNSLGELYAYTFYIKKDDASILDLEEQHRRGGAADPFRISQDNNRLIIGPTYVSDEMAKTHGILEPFKGQIICWNGYRGGRCETNSGWLKVCIGENVWEAYECRNNTLEWRGIEPSGVSCGGGEYKVDKINTASVSSGILKTYGIVPANFVPPTLQQLENIMLDIIYVVWAFIGTFASFQLLYIGFEIMVSGFSPERLGKEYSKLAYWIVGLIGFFLAIPALHFVYNSLNIQHSRCFYFENGDSGYDLTLPGFTFFFKEVCTSEYTLAS